MKLYFFLSWVIVLHYKIKETLNIDLLVTSKQGKNLFAQPAMLFVYGNRKLQLYQYTQYGHCLFKWKTIYFMTREINIQYPSNTQIQKEIQLKESNQLFICNQRNWLKCQCIVPWFTGFNHSKLNISFTNETLV